MGHDLANHGQGCGGQSKRAGDAQPRGQDEADPAQLPGHHHIHPGVNAIRLIFFVADQEAKEAKLFFLAKPFHSCLIFEGRLRPHLQILSQTGKACHG